MCLAFGQLTYLIEVCYCVYIFLVLYSYVCQYNRRTRQNFIYYMFITLRLPIYVVQHFVMNAEWLEQLVGCCVSSWRRRHAVDKLAVEKAAASELLNALRTSAAASSA